MAPGGSGGAGGGREGEGESRGDWEWSGFAVLTVSCNDARLVLHVLFVPSCICCFVGSL